MKVLYILSEYPQLSQTYIKSEIMALDEDIELKIISLATPNISDKEHSPFELINDEQKIIEVIDEFKPNVIHSHYLILAKFIYNISLKTGIPFTLRAHSFDVLQNDKTKDFPFNKKNLPNYINNDLCKGVLIFPFTRNLLLHEGGIENNKMIDVPPVVNVAHFYNESKNGEAIMNIGACLPKKNMESFIQLSKIIPQKQFNLYALGYNVKQLAMKNMALKGHVNFISPVLYSQMPSEYKKHEWLVYTADKEIKTVGWPMAVMEAMASGTMVCFPNIRPDIKEYIGDSGYIYENIEDLKDIIEQPVDKVKREKNFEHAKKFDIKKNIHLLIDLWKS